MFNFTLKRRLKTDPFYRFKSLDEVRVAGELGVRIDVNLAGVDDWLRLPGISIHQARYLVNLGKLGVKFLCIEDIASALNIPVERVKSWEYILSFCYYDAISMLSPVKVNFNFATLSELTTIPIIDSNLAERIVKNRLDNGNFTNLIDLKNRLNLTSDFISDLMPYCYF
jgi:DNA uptake protein ComE-like DNA-binding protein